MTNANETTTRVTAGEALGRGAQYLERAGVENARLDMSLLLAEALGTDRLKLYCDLDRPLDANETARAREMLTRRSKREPLAYILGRREFYGLDFAVTRDVLIPRPDTETLVELIVEWIRSRPEDAPEPALADIGTGSGAIAVAAAHACPAGRWIAVDISGSALAVARRNAETHGVAGRIEFRSGSLLGPLDEPVDAICSNPPYVAETERPGLAPEVRDWEPDGALFSGEAGLDCLRELIAAASAKLNPGGLFAVEMGCEQAGAVSERLKETGAFEEIEVRRDLGGRPRCVAARRRS